MARAVFSEHYTCNREGPRQQRGGTVTGGRASGGRCELRWGQGVMHDIYCKENGAGSPGGYTNGDDIQRQGYKQLSGCMQRALCLSIARDTQTGPLHVEDIPMQD